MRLAFALPASLVALLAASAGCLDTSVPLDPMPNIACDGPDQCPSGTTCLISANRCISDTITDTTGPSVLSFSLDRRVARAGDVLSADILLDEALGEVPQLKLGDSGAVFSIVGEAEGASQLRAVYAVLGDEPEGNAGIVGEFEDVWGNVRDEVSLDTVLLDFTPPTVMVEPAGPLILAAGDSRELTLTFDEALPSPPVVVLDDGDESEALGVTPADGSYAVTLASAGLDDGRHVLRVSAADAAGNERAADVFEVVVDTTPPQTLLEVDRRALRPGESVVLTASSDEPLSALARPTVVATGPTEVSAECELAGLLALRCAITLPQDGEWTLGLEEVTDVAGNVAPPEPAGVALVDGVAPQLTGLALNRPIYSRDPAFRDLVASFQLDDTDATLAASLDTCALDCDVDDTGAGTCSAILGLGDGECAVDSDAAALVIVASDTANNTTVEVAGVSLDLVAPRVDPDSLVWEVLPPAELVPFTPDILLPGIRATVSFLTNEPLADASRLDAVGAEATVPFTLDLAFGLSYGYRMTLPVVPEGSYEVVAHVVDALGNADDVVLELPPPAFVVAATIDPPCRATYADGSEGCTDFDGDGFEFPGDGCALPWDCDDLDPSSFPGAPERPGDGKANDCGGGLDVPLDEASAVFASPTGDAGAAGTRADPTDLASAIALAATSGLVVAAASGEYTTAATIDAETSIFGGYDASFAVNDGVSRLRFEGTRGLGYFLRVLPPVGAANARVDRLALEGNCRALEMGDDAVGSNLTISFGGADCSTAIGLRGLSNNVVSRSTFVGTDVISTMYGVLLQSGRVVASDVEATDADGTAWVRGVHANAALYVDRTTIRVMGDDISGAGSNDVVTAVGNAIFMTPDGYYNRAFSGTDGLVLFHNTVRFDSPNQAFAAQASSGNTQAYGNILAGNVVGGGGFILQSPGHVYVANDVLTPCPFSHSGCVQVVATFEAGCGSTYGHCTEARDNTEALATFTDSEGVTLEAMSPLIAAAPSFLDLGAPPSVVVDLDGDCRGATVDIGADAR
jgi:hypothetical protein